MTHTAISSGHGFLRRAFIFLIIPMLLLNVLWMPLSNAAASPTALLVVGDSLSAEYGLPRGSGWVKLMSDRHPNLVVTNASISGETTAGGLTRLPALLSNHRPSVVVIELGANDALRGLDLNVTRNNLLSMVRLAKKANAAVLLVGVNIPANYGAAYSAQFAEMYRSVAKAERVKLVPSLLAGFATDIRYFQNDGLHPNQSAQVKILDSVWPTLNDLLRTLTQPKAGV